MKKRMTKAIPACSVPILACQPVFLLLLIFMLVFGFSAANITAFGMDLKELRINRKPVGGMAAFTPSEPMQYLSEEDTSHMDELMASYVPQEDLQPVNNAVAFYYYDHLDPLTKEIYDVVLQVAKDPENEENIGLMMTDVDPSGDEFYFAFNAAARAVCFDHPELFWLYAMDEASLYYGSDQNAVTGFYFVYFYVSDPVTKFTERTREFNQAVEEFLADIDRNASQYQIALQIHNKLISLVSYNTPSLTMPVFQGQNLCHTAYGALVKDSSGVAHYPVCDGYSLAYEYLLQQCGIEAAFLGGIAGDYVEGVMENHDLGDLGGHAWNIICLDGTWYEVDSTWDDEDMEQVLEEYAPGTVGYDFFTTVLNDTLFMESLTHKYFLVSTDVMTHFEPGSRYDFYYQSDPEPFSLAWPQVHFRLTDHDKKEDPDGYLFDLAPIAEKGYEG